MSSKYDIPAVIDKVADRLYQGIPLAVICREPGMPSYRSVYLWRADNPEFDKQLKQARDDGCDAIAHRCRAVARGDEQAGSTGDVKRDRLIVETDLKLIAKWDKRYGDKIEHSGTISHAATDLPTMTNQLVTQVTMNPTLRPVLQAWAQDLLAQLGEAT